MAWAQGHLRGCVRANLPGEEIPVPMKSLGGSKGDPFLTPSRWHICSIGSICKIGVGQLFYPDRPPKVGGGTFLSLYQFWEWMSPCD